MNRTEITEELFRMRDPGYAALQSRILPNVEKERIIGVRTPELRAFAKKLYRDEERDAFLAELPHAYFDENQLHAFIISEEKDFIQSVRAVETFLPFVDNWATCDQLLPRAFRKEPEKLLPYIRRWIESEHTYTVRFAVGMLMQHFLEDRFVPEYAEMVANIKSEAYYIKMMVAWYFATALARQYETALPYLEQKRLDDWTHNKAIQKSVESYRITPEQKAYLKTLKVHIRRNQESTRKIPGGKCGPVP